MGCDSGFVYVFYKVSNSRDSAFSVLPRAFLSKEPLETVDSSTTVDFLVSSRISNILFIAGLFERFCGWGVLLGSAKVFGSLFLRFCHRWDVKPSGCRYLLSCEGFVSTFA